MKYILIIVLIYGNGGGAAIDHIEFPTEASCKSAGKAYVAEVDGLMRSAEYVCVVHP